MRAAAQYFYFSEKERPFLCPAKQMGSKARALLALPGFSGKVLAVLSATVYLASGEGEIFWLSQEDFPMHRRCLRALFRPRSISLGQNFFVKGPFLRISDEVIFDLRPATEWKPPDVRAGHTESLTVVRTGTRRLVKAVTLLGDVKGFGRMIPLIWSLVDGERQAISDVDPLLAKAQGSILELAAVCLNLDLSEVIRRGKELIGLGPGLTPSGDDFLGGLLFAAHWLKTAYPQDFHWEEEPVMDLTDWASAHTHPVSHTLLRDHGLGHGPEPLHKVVASLFKGQDLGHTLDEAKRLLRVGDTSGWDTLAGMLTGMLLAEGKLKNANGGKR